MAIGQAARPIEGAVATLGVDERVAFIRRTYAHLAGAIGLFVAGEWAFQQTQAAADFTRWAWYQGRWNWLMVIGLFMVAGYLGDRWARSASSRGMQYLGLGVTVAAYVVVFGPLLHIAAYYYPQDPQVIEKAAVITLFIFGGLTGTVFLTRKDFSFLRGALSIATMAAFGLIVASIIFGFSLGIIFAGAMVVLMAGWVLYYTSQVLAHYPPTAHVAASLALFSAIATMFYYVLIFLMELQGD